MAYNFRQRVQNNKIQQPQVIYNDPTLVPVGKMSFTVSQWKTIGADGKPTESDGKWTTNLMNFAYLQDRQLWLEFPIAKTNLMIPKTWKEVAVNKEIHQEMLDYHSQYKNILYIIHINCFITYIFIS